MQREGEKPDLWRSLDEGTSLIPCNFPKWGIAASLFLSILGPCRWSDDGACYPTSGKIIKTEAAGINGDLANFHLCSRVLLQTVVISDLSLASFFPVLNVLYSTWAHAWVERRRLPTSIVFCFGCSQRALCLITSHSSGVLEIPL